MTQCLQLIEADLTEKDEKDKFSQLREDTNKFGKIIGKEKDRIANFK